MISNAFRGAVENEVAQQNQGINTITTGMKDTATAILGTLGFAGKLGEGMLAEASKHSLANKVGGIGGNLMLASMEEKKKSVQENKAFTAEEVTETIRGQLGDNPINRSAMKQLGTVFEKLQQAKEEKIINEKGQIETSFGDVDPNSALGKKIMESFYNEPEVAKGYTRLYRGLENEYNPNYKGKRDNPEGYESWTNNRELAKQYGKNVYYMDFKNSDIADSYLDENPNSETYGDRNYIYKNSGKKVGLNNISGDEYLLYTQHDKHENSKYNKIGGNK